MHNVKQSYSNRETLHDKLTHKTMQRDYHDALTITGTPRFMLATDAARSTHLCNALVCSRSNVNCVTLCICARPLTKISCHSTLKPHRWFRCTSRNQGTKLAHQHRRTAQQRIPTEPSIKTLNQAQVHVCHKPDTVTDKRIRSEPARRNHQEGHRGMHLVACDSKSSVCKSTT